MSENQQQSIDMDSQSIALTSKKRPLVVIGLVVLVLGIAGGAFAMYAVREPSTDPTRVVVVMHGGVDPGVDGPLLRGFERMLRDFGFDVVRDDQAISQGEPARAIATARERALGHNAASTVILEPRVATERDGAVQGHHLYRSSLTVRVVPTKEDQEATHRELEFTYEQPSAVLAAASVSQTWLDTLGPEAVDLLYRTQAVTRTVGGETMPMERMRYQVKLQERRVMVETRRERALAWEEYQHREREAVRNLTNAEPGVRCVGDPSRPWSAIGITADGSAAIVHEAYRSPIFGMLDEGLSWTEPPESILVVPFEGGEPRPILRVGHFYGLASTTPDGRFATAALFASENVPAVVSIDLSNGRVGQRWLLEPRERAGYRETSPDGQVIFAARERAGWGLYAGDGPIDLPALRSAEIVTLSEGESRVVGQIDDGSILVLKLDGSEELAIPAPQGTRVIDVLGARDGAVQFYTRVESGSCAITALDPNTRTFAETILPTCVDEPQQLPDGRLVGIARQSAPGDPPGDDEVVLIDPTTSETTILTRGNLQDELVYPSANGRRIVFSRRMEDWPEEYDVRLYRRIVCYADIPPR